MMAPGRTMRGWSLLVLGFLPLLVYWLAEGMWGLKVGLLAGMGWALGEWLWGLWRGRGHDPLILMDIVLIGGFGAASFLLDNPAFIRLKPAVLEGVLLALVVSSWAGPVDVVGLMLKRQMGRGLGVERLQGLLRSPEYRMMMKGFSLYLALHMLLVLVAAFGMSRNAWALIAGPLFYLGFVPFLLLLRWMRRRQRVSEIPPAAGGDEEWLPHVDERGQVLGRVSRTQAHREDRFLHPVVHWHLFDDRDRLFLQKRGAGKVVAPLAWDTAVGGHLAWGEQLGEGLLREAQEELGVVGVSPVPAFRYVWEGGDERELVYVFVGRAGAGQIRIPPGDEVADGRFFTQKKVRELVRRGETSPQLAQEWSRYSEEICRAFSRNVEKDPAGPFPLLGTLSARERE